MTFNPFHTTVLWLVGPPGAGKTTLARELLGDVQYLIPTPKLTVGRGVVAAGHYTGQTFDGADTVPYNGAAAVLDLWEREFRDAPVLLLDGDRFSNANAIKRLAPTGARLRCVHLTAEQALLDARRAARGSQQNETWMKGRVTKATNFAALFTSPGALLNLNAADTDNAARIRAWLES